MIDVVIAEADPVAAGWALEHLPELDLTVQLVGDALRVDDLLDRVEARVFVLDWRLPGLDPNWWMLRRAGMFRHQPTAFALVDRGDDRAWTMARLAGVNDVFRKGADGRSLQAALVASLGSSNLAGCTFDPHAPLSGGSDWPRRIALGHFLDALPQCLTRLSTARRLGREAYVAALRKFAAESAACGVQALARRARRLARETARGPMPVASGHGGLTELAEQTAAEIARWLLTC